jgi:hypothetical protein
MAKVEKFNKGALVSTTKLNGEKLLGIYEHGYDSGNECCVLGPDNKKFCVKLKDTKEADEEEKKVIQETIIKPRREAEKARKKAQEAEDNDEPEELTEEDMESPTDENNEE